MSQDLKLAEPIELTSRAALEIEVDPTALRRYVPAPPPVAGSFDFSDGTTGGWSLDQLYDADGPVPVQITNFPVPPPGSAGFTLTNNQNLALSAGTTTLLAPKSVTMLGFYFLSPDLKGRIGWSAPGGYALDFQRRFFGWLTNAPKLNLVQLQAEFTDKASGVPKLVVESDIQTQQPVFHPTAHDQPYAFTWTAGAFQDKALELRRLRVYCKFVNAAGAISGEAAPSGDWLIGNVRPLPAK